MTLHASRLPFWVTIILLSVFAVQAQDDRSGLAPVVESQTPLQSPLPLGSVNASQAPSANVNAPASSSTSASKQFIVHGASLKTRSVFCLLADEVAASLDRLLKDASPRRLPVVIVLKSGSEARRSGSPVTTNISQLAYGGFHLQVNVQLRQGFHTQDFNDELVRILLAERILRQHKELSSNRDRVLPDWLLTGVSQALVFRDRAKPSVLFAAVFRSGRIYSIDGVLQAKSEELDSMSRSIYQTSCCALVLTLLDQSDGPVRFGRFLNALATSGQSDRELLKEHFPTLGISSNSLEKWWSLQMATLATPTSMESLGVSETERYLNEALTLQFHLKEPTKKKSTLSPAPEASPSLPEAPATEPTDEDKPSRFKLPFFGSRNKDVFFPFLKRNSSGEAEKTAAELENDASNSSNTESTDKANTKPSSDSKPSDLQSPEPIASLQKKSNAERKLSTQPKVIPPPVPELPRKNDDQLKISDTPELPHSKKTEEGMPDDSSQKPSSDKGSLLNPLNWFRKDDEDPTNPDEKSATEPEQPQQSQSRPPSPIISDSASEFISIPITEYSRVMKREDRGKILQQNLERLNALKQRAHPLYRDLIGEYAEVIRSLMHGKDKGISEKLDSLSARRVAINNKASEVEKYVDWYEANSGGYSNTFDDYFKLQESIQNELNPRADSISQYLDLLDKEYQ